MHEKIHGIKVQFKDLHPRLIQVLQDERAVQDGARLRLDVFEGHHGRVPTRQPHVAVLENQLLAPLGTRPLHTDGIIFL